MRCTRVTLGWLLIVVLSACGDSSGRRQYTLQGQILSVSPDRVEASIKHEEIPGFMAAMTMPYKVKDAKEYADLKAGDLITSTLVVESDGAYLEHVRKVGEAPFEQSSPASPAASAASGFELLRPGEAVPDARFVNQDGAPIAFASFKGAPLVVTFMYTKCPMPTFCPLMDKHFATIQASLAKDAALQQVRLVSISFDPIADTPEVLKRHAASLGADLARWTFLTGDRDDIDRFAARFGVTITRDLNNPLEIAHNLRTAIIDADGRLVKAYSGNEWQPAQVVTDVTRLVRGDKG